LIEMRFFFSKKNSTDEIFLSHWPYQYHDFFHLNISLHLPLPHTPIYLLMWQYWRRCVDVCGCVDALKCRWMQTSTFKLGSILRQFYYNSPNSYYFHFKKWKRSAINISHHFLNFYENKIITPFPRINIRCVTKTHTLSTYSVCLWVFTSSQSLQPTQDWVAVCWCVDDRVDDCVDVLMY